MSARSRVQLARLIRGRTEPMTVHPVAGARTLSALVDDLGVVAA
jgi:hypothetical protein